MERPLFAFPTRLEERRISQLTGLICCLALLLLATAVSVPQKNSPRQNPPLFNSSPGASSSDADPQDIIREQERLRTLNIERQKSMVSDANKLLKLVNELNAEIATNADDRLTPMQLRKVEEIEKLAHNVKQKMSTPLFTAPVYNRPPFLMR